MLKTHYSNEIAQSRNDIILESINDIILQKSINYLPDYFLCNDREIDDPQRLRVTIANEFNSYFENCCKIALESMPSQATSSN